MNLIFRYAPSKLDLKLDLWEAHSALGDFRRKLGSDYTQLHLSIIS